MGKKLSEEKEREAFQAVICRELADVCDMLSDSKSTTKKQQKNFKFKADVLRGMAGDFESDV